MLKNSLINAYNSRDDVAFNKALEQMERERSLLAEGIVSVAKAAGIVNGEMSLTGPQLTLLCYDLCELVSKK